MRKILDYYYKSLKFAITLAMFVILLPVSMQILSRYTAVIPPYIWTEEISRFCFIWIIMIGSVIGVREKTHFEISVLPVTEWSRRTQFVFQLVVHIGVTFLALIFVFKGYEFTRDGQALVSELAGLPMVAIYCAWPLAGVSWLLFLAEQLYDDIALYRRGADT